MSKLTTVTTRVSALFYFFSLNGFLKSLWGRRVKSRGGGGVVAGYDCWDLESFARRLKKVNRI